MNHKNIYVVSERNLSIEYGTSVTAFTTLGKAQEYVHAIIEEYNLDGVEIVNDGLNWYDNGLNYFDILITATMVGE